VQNIALGRRLISDDECEECFNKSAAERIVLSCGTGVLGGANPEIDEDIGEPTSGTAEELNLGVTNLIGAPNGWMPPSALINFLSYRPKSGEPPEEELDNPAGWSMSTFTPSFHPKTKNYDSHRTPSGVNVVPADGTGKCVMNGWEFHYKNWKAEPFDVETYAWTGARFGDLKPDSRKEYLDTNMTRMHRLNAEQMRHKRLFFY